MRTVTFNTGWLCKNCGPVQEVEKATVKKVQRVRCKVCDGLVTKWERSLNQRPGRCSNCAHGSFTSRIHISILLRECKRCGEVVNPDTKELITKGNEDFKYAK